MYPAAEIMPKKQAEKWQRNYKGIRHSIRGLKMDAVLSINNNAQYIVFPFWPDETEITAGAGNTTYNGLSFNIRMVGIEELKTLEISSFFRPENTLMLALMPT